MQRARAAPHPAPPASTIPKHVVVKAQSPLLGFNNNVKHRGRVFHIQTEDSGVRHPHVITHLFADGGRILKTTKTSYAEHIGSPSLQETVRSLMQEQHKAMFIALRDGQYDYLFDDRAPRPAPPPTSVVAPAAPAAHAPRVAVAQPSGPPRKATPRPRLDVDPRALQAQLQRSASPLEVAAANSPIDLDLSALERAADEAHTPFFQQLQPNLPPPPAAVLGKRPDGRSITLTSYRSSSVGPPAAEASSEALGAPAPPAPSPGHLRTGTSPGIPARLPSSPGGSSARQMAPTMPTRPSLPQAPARPPATVTGPQPPARATGGSGRYAPTRPAAIFTPRKPAEGASLFGDDLISEKSLDEVILSYLAEDLEGEKK